MNNKKNIPRVSLALFAFTCLTAPFLSAQVAFTGATHTENFDALPVYTGTGTATLSFNNNSTITGWYSSVGTGSGGRSSAGAEAASGALYNFGESGSADRALSLHTRDGYAANTAFLGMQLLNDSGATIDAVTLSFDVEQWRRNANAVTWDFAYLVTAEATYQLTESGYTENAAGNAASSLAGGAAGLNGNSNSTSVSFTMTGLNWQAGEYLWLRWGSNQTLGSSAAIALDNVSVSTIPEPTTAGVLIGSGALLIGAIRRGRRA